MPDVYPISSNGTVGRLYGVRSWVALSSDTAICPRVAWFACRWSCIHKFTNVDASLLWARSLVSALLIQCHG